MQANVIFANKMIENIEGNFDIHTCLHSFEPYLLANKRTEKPVLHVSLNPDPKDVLSDGQLAQMAQFYMQKMGYGDQPYIVFKHEDIERKHVHIVSLRIDENGRKIDHNFEKRRSMSVCRELEQKFNLLSAIKSPKSQPSQLSLTPVNSAKGDIKRQIADVLQPIASEYYFLSFKEYKSLLSLYNIDVEEVRNEKNECKGLVYSAKNDKGEKVGNPFKSSLFGKYAGIDALEKRIELSAQIIKNKGLKERSKQIIAAALSSTNSRADFEKALEKQGISVIFRQNEQGRIYGATFVDHLQKCVFNGSRLGKEFSANIFNEKFNEQTSSTKKTVDNPLSPVSQPSHQSQNNNENKQNNPENNYSLPFEEGWVGVFSGLFDLFTPETAG